MTYASEVLADSPDLFLKLEEASGATTAVDSSGNGRNFTANAVTWAQVSLLGDGTGSSALFNGSAYLTKASATWMDSTSVTVEVRYHHVASAGTRMWISRWTSAGNRPWLFGVTANKVRARVDNAGSDQVVGATTLADNTDYTIAFRVDNTTLKVYVDGVEDGSFSHAGPTAVGATFEVCRAASTSLSPGQAQGLAFWASALSPTRLAAHHAAAVASNAAVGTASITLSASADAGATGGGSASLSLSGTAAAAGDVTGAASLTFSATGGTDAPADATGSASLTLSASGTSEAPSGGSAALTFSAIGPDLNVHGGALLDLSALIDVAAPVGATATLTLSAGGVAVAVFTTDLSNALDGLDLLLTAIVTMAVPVVAPPPTSAVKYDKAIAYPVPVMVNGRPT